MLIAIFLAMGTVTATTVGQVLMKHGMNRVGSLSPAGGNFLGSVRDAITDPYLLGGVVLIMLAVPFWFEVLARLPLSVAYPMVSMGYVITLVLGSVFLNETVTLLRITGVSIIVLGVIVVAKSN